jgi:FlaG/FlaF family flagellin (archaellin)
MRSRGISKPVGVVLLVTIVLLLSVSVASLALGFSLQTPTPQVAVEDEFYTVYDNSTGEIYQYARVQHEGGDSLEPEELRLVIEVDGERIDDPERTGSVTGPYRAGDRLEFNLTEADLCGVSADAFSMSIVHEPSNGVVAERTVPIERGADVQVVDNAVVTDRPFVATLTVVGIAASASSGDDIQPDIVYGRVVISYPNGTTETLTPWPDGNGTDGVELWEDDLNHPTLPGSYSYTTGQLPANASVTLEMRAPKPDGWQEVPAADGGPVDETIDGTQYDILEPDPGAGIQDPRFWIDASDPDNQNIILLRDGESVPTYGVAASHQPSLGGMLGSQLGPSGTLALDDREVAVLYELSESDAEPSNAPPANGGGGNPDYNDAVGLIDIEPVEVSLDREGGDPVLKCS